MKKSIFALSLMLVVGVVEARSAVSVSRSVSVSRTPSIVTPSRTVVTRPAVVKQKVEVNHTTINQTGSSAAGNFVSGALGAAAGAAAVNMLMAPNSEASVEKSPVEQVIRQVVVCKTQDGQEVPCPQSIEKPQE